MDISSWRCLSDYQVEMHVNRYKFGNGWHIDVVETRRPDEFRNEVGTA